MKKNIGYKLMLLLVLLVMVAGCAKTEKTANETAVSEMGTEMETETKAVEETVAETESETETETETEAETQTEAETETETEEAKLPEYEVTSMDEVSMYAKSAVNVRKGPSTDFKKYPH